MVSDTVTELDVVTGRGEKLTCSPVRRELRHVCDAVDEPDHLVADTLPFPGGGHEPRYAW